AGSPGEVEAWVAALQDPALGRSAVRQAVLASDESFNLAQEKLTGTLVGDFDISNFAENYDPNSYPSDQEYVSGNLKFVSSASWNASTPRSGATSGSSASPAWVLVGFRPFGATFTPLLLVYGTVTLYTTTQPGNRFTWTDGLYTVSNSVTSLGGNS